MMDFLVAWKPLFVVIHVLSVIIGFGGANVSDLLFFRFLKDFSISKHEAETLRAVADVILFAIVLVNLSGIALYLPNMAELNQNPGFLLKATAVFFVTLNGIFLHVFICPRLISISFALQSDQRLDLAFLKKTVMWNRIAFAAGAVSVTSWYTAFLMAYLKQYVAEFHYITLLTGYLTIVLIAMFVSQLMEQWLYARGKKSDIRG